MITDNWYKWHQRGLSDPAAVLRRTAKRGKVSDKQMRFNLETEDEGVHSVSR